jgi:site-specific recombinase XerD
MPEMWIQTGGMMIDPIERFSQDLVVQGKSPLTVRAYTDDLRAYAAWVQCTYGERFVPGQITANDVVAYRDHMLGGRLISYATIARRLAALSAFCAWSVRNELLASNPADGVKAPRQARTPPRALSRVDVNRLIRKTEQAGNPLHVAVVTMLANTGIRVHELCLLQLADVEISERGGRLAVRGKGNKFRRVPLNLETRRALHLYMKYRPDVDTEQLLLGRRSEPLTESGAWRIVRKYARLAGVDASPHTLRHTFATRLLREAGADLVVVADLLGHENINTTARYTRSTEDDQQKAVEAL